MTDSCLHCKFYKDKECHRYPPVHYTTIDSDSNNDNVISNISGWGTTEAYFPCVKETDWCGEFKPND